MRSRLLVPFLVLAISTSLAACGGDDDSGGGGGTGADGGIAGPDGSTACPAPQDLLPAGWTPVDQVSSGAVTNQADGDAMLTTVDASAGGIDMQATSPFVYLDLTGAEATAVNITDVESFSDATWDIALKRYVIRANGGDSGPGGVEVAALQGDDLSAVNATPDQSRFGADSWTGADCSYQHDGIGGPLTRFSDWFSVDGTGTLTPNPLVYVVKTHTGTLVKIDIQTYYGNPDDPTQAAVVQLRWQPL